MCGSCPLFTGLCFYRARGYCNNKGANPSLGIGHSHSVMSLNMCAGWSNRAGEPEQEFTSRIDPSETCEDRAQCHQLCPASDRGHMVKMEVFLWTVESAGVCPLSPGPVYDLGLTVSFCH